MSPTVFRQRGFRFYFFSREERRMHVHVSCSSGEAKFWMEPTIELAMNRGLKQTELRRAERLIEEHADEIQTAWHRHFGA
jgi:hypothetical protein